MKTAYHILMTIVALVFGLSVLVGLVVVPSLQGILNLAHEIEQEHRRMEGLHSHILQLRATKENLEKVKSGLISIGPLTIVQGNEVDFFALLEKKNHEYDLDQLIALGETTPAPFKLNELPLQIQIQGAFLNILGYLNELEQLPILLPFTTMKFQYTDGITDIKKVHAQLQGKLYVSLH